MNSKKHRKKAVRKNSKGRKQGKLWPYLLAFAVALGLLFLESLLPPSSGIWIAVGLRTAISLLALGMLFFKWMPEKMPVCGVLNVLATVLLLWIFLLPAKADVLAAVFLIAAGSVLAVIAQCRCVGFGTIYAVTVALYMLSALTLRDGLLFQSGAQLPYWLPALIAAILCGACIAVLVGRDILNLEDERTSECVCFVILATAAAFFTVQYAAIGLNYALDTSAPEEYTVQITDRHSSGSHRSRSYYLTVNAPDGDLEFSVSRDCYRSAEAGDSATVCLFDGAFGDAYYLLDLHTP